MSMTRIHQQAGSRQHERWYQFGIRYMQGARRATWVVAVLALLASLATAQSNSLLNGSVSDPSGASVAGAKITLTDAATGLQRTTTSNGAGLYQFLDVPPGNYRLEATASGFAPYLAPDVKLVVKTPTTVNIHFQVAGVETKVTVEAQAPLINRTDASLGNTVEENQIEGHTERRSEWHAQRPIQCHARRHWGERPEQWLCFHQRPECAA
jgi:hypothetical protein